MENTNAPTRQLLITENNITGIVNKYFVKKRDISDPRIVNTLRNLCKIADKQKDPVITLLIFEARKQILEEASEIYGEAGQDELFDEQMKELNVILDILQEHTITR